MMSAQSDEMNQLAGYPRAHPMLTTRTTGDAAAALPMVAAIRNIQAGMAASCGLSMDQAMSPGMTPGH
jgi:hypothetical protein